MQNSDDKHVFAFDPVEDMKAVAAKIDEGLAMKIIDRRRSVGKLQKPQKPAIYFSCSPPRSGRRPFRKPINLPPEPLSGRFGIPEFHGRAASRLSSSALKAAITSSCEKVGSKGS